VSCAAITLCVASQRMLVVVVIAAAAAAAADDVVYFVIDSVRKLLDVASQMECVIHTKVTDI